MSDIHNHILCALDSQKTLKDESLKDLINRYPLLYRFGSMGGDIFYYYNAASAHPDAWVNGTGDFFHSHVNELFGNAKNFIKQLPKEDAGKLTVYLMGFISHHSLDAQSHPFINYFGGCRIDGREETEIYRYTHKRYEVLLDMLFAGYRKEPMCDVLQLAQLPQEDINLITRLYQYLLKVMKKEIIPDNLLSSCLKDYKKLIKISNQSYLYPFMSLADKIAKEKYRFTRPFYAMSSLEKQLDIMNLSHQMWADPCDEHDKMRFSYPEIFGYAVRDGAKRMKKYYDFLHDVGNDKKSDTIFKNIDFSTGSSVYQKEDIKFMKCILL